MERTFSALVLASIATLAIPMLTNSGTSPVASMELADLEARADVAMHGFAAYLEREGYQLGAAQLMAAGGVVETYPALVWSPPLDPQGYGAALASTPQG